MSTVPESEARWIFSDLDGTIMREDGVIPRSASEAIISARATGHRVVLSTGRSAGQITADVRALSFDAIISGSGWRVELADGSVLVDAAFDPMLVEAVTSTLAEAGIPFYFETHSGLVGTADSLAHLTEMSARFEPGPARDRWQQHLDAFTRTLGRDDDPRPAGITKVVHIGAIDAALPVGVRAMPPSIPSLPAGWGEILPDGIHKGVAMHQVLDHFGVEVSRSIALGDGFNDIEMLAMAGIGVAMGNACPEALEVSDMVVTPVDEDGFAMAFKMLGLI